MIKATCFFSFLLINFSAGHVVVNRVESFVQHELVPDILSLPPDSLLSVTFPNGVQALEGNELSPDEVRGTPVLKWNANPQRFYTIIMCDPDAPSRLAARDRSFLHWLVVNVPADDITSGDTIVPIINSHPEPETGLHRYVFLVYEQPHNIIFDELPDDSFEGRKGFSPEKFAYRYSYGAPVAGNFYQTETIDDNYEYIEN